MKFVTVIIVEHTHGKGDVLHLVKFAIDVVRKTTLRKNADKDSGKPDRCKGKQTQIWTKKNSCTHRCKVHEIKECQSDDNCS